MIARLAVKPEAESGGDWTGSVSAAEGCRSSVDAQPPAERVTSQFDDHRASGGPVSHPFVFPGIDPAGNAAAARNFTGQPVEPDQSVVGQRRGRHRRTAECGNLCQPPGAAGFSFFQQQIEVPPRRVVRMAGVLKQNKAGHGSGGAHNSRKAAQ